MENLHDKLKTITAKYIEKNDCNSLLYVLLTALRNYGDTVHDFWTYLMELDAKKSNASKYLSIFTHPEFVISKKNIVILKEIWMKCYEISGKIPDHEKEFIQRNLDALLAKTSPSIIAEPFGKKSQSYEDKMAAFIENMVMNYDTSQEGPHWVSFVRNPDHEQHIVELKDGEWKTMLTNEDASSAFIGKKYITFSLGNKSKKTKNPTGIFSVPPNQQHPIFVKLRELIIHFFTPIAKTNSLKPSNQNPEHQLLIDAVSIGLDKLLTKEDSNESKLIQVKGLSAKWDAAGKSGIPVETISRILETTSIPPMNPVTQQCIYANQSIRIDCLDNIDVKPEIESQTNFKKATSIAGIVSQIKKFTEESQIARFLEFKRFGDSATSDETHLLNRIYFDPTSAPQHFCTISKNTNDKSRFTIGATHDKSALCYWLLNKQPVMFTHFSGGHGEKELYITCLYPEKEDPDDTFYTTQNALMQRAIDDIHDLYMGLSNTIDYCIRISTVPEFSLNKKPIDLYSAFRSAYSHISSKAQSHSDKMIAYMHLRALYLFENCLRAEMKYKRALYAAFKTDGPDFGTRQNSDQKNIRLEYNRKKGLLNRVYELQKWKGIIRADFQQVFEGYANLVVQKISPKEDNESEVFVLKHDFDMNASNNSTIKKFIGYERDKGVSVFYRKMSQDAYRQSIDSLKGVIEPSRTSRGGGFQTRFTEDCNRLLNMFHSIEKAILERISKINDMPSLRGAAGPEEFPDFEDDIALCEEYREAIETLAQDVGLAKGWLFQTGQQGGMFDWLFPKNPNKRQKLNTTIATSKTTSNTTSKTNSGASQNSGNSGSSATSKKSATSGFLLLPTPPQVTEYIPRQQSMEPMELESMKSRESRESRDALEQLCLRFSEKDTNKQPYEYKPEDITVYELLNEYERVEDVFLKHYSSGFRLNVEAFADFLFPIFITYTFEERELLAAIAKSFEARLAEAEKPDASPPQQGGSVPSSFTPHSLRWYYKTYYPSYYELYYKNHKEKDNHKENSDLDSEQFVKI